MVLVVESNGAASVRLETRRKVYGNLKYKLISGWIPDCYIDPQNII